MRTALLSLLILLLISLSSFSQDTTQSLAFKNRKPQQKAPYFYRPDLAYQIWQNFKLTQEANAGDPIAQHELGLRFLLGDGVPADTSQAVHWIKKAVERNLTSAKYNYAILLINGIGVEWDPFNAFKYFKSAAEDGMVQAQYVVGILHTDNLVTQRNWNIAYYWIKKSADGDYEPAKEILTELEPRISKTVVDSLLSDKQSPTETKPVSDPSENLTSSLGLVFIDFDTMTDSIIEITDSMLIADIEIIGADSIVKNIKTDSLKSLDKFITSSRLELLTELSHNGSPEAQTIIGRLYEKGIYYKKDLLYAAAYYFRALRNDSPKATNLLWQLSQKKEFLDLVHKETQNGNNIAKFVWYGLISTGFDNRITLNDALNLLEESADEYYLPAMIELGLNYYTGRFGNKNVNTGLGVWETAARLGSKEAELRLTASRILDSFVSVESQNDFKRLQEGIEEGSLFAMVSAGLCYDQGLGTHKSKSEAVHYFRLAAQRGSQFAYEELKRIYDEMRPSDREFLIQN